MDRIGSFGYDPWGFHLKGIKRTFPIAKFFYERFFRVEAYGLENIPAEGRALIIPNHSGQLPLDGALVGYSMLTNPHGPRTPKAMIERFFPTIPFIGNALNRMGAVIGNPENCRVMLENEQAIIVFPEGIGGTSKVFSERYQLQKFGKGFIHLAMKHKTPIIPVGIVGCEESIVSLADFKEIGKKIGLPSFPMVIPVLWPTKVIIHYGKPIVFDSKTVNDEEITKNVQLVKNRIKNLIDLGLAKRQNLFD